MVLSLHLGKMQCMLSFNMHPKEHTFSQRTQHEDIYFPSGEMSDSCVCQLTYITVSNVKDDIMQLLEQKCYRQSFIVILENI